MKTMNAMGGSAKHSSIVAVRDPGDRSRYLLYHDVRWDCDFFPNHDSNGAVRMEQPVLKSWLSDAFCIPECDFSLAYVGEKEHAKPSLSHGGALRDYVYRLWVADVTVKPEAWNDDSFTVGGKDCRWKTIAGMEADPHIMRVNEDVVGMVKDYVSRENQSRRSRRILQTCLY